MHTRAVEILKATSAKDLQAAKEAHTILEREVQDMRKEVRDLVTSHRAEIELIMVRLNASNGFSITCLYDTLPFPVLSRPYLSSPSLSCRILFVVCSSRLT